MSYYRPCPLCSANLDPGERCDCQDIEKAALVEHYQDGKVGRLIHATNEEQIRHTHSIYKKWEGVKYEGIAK